MVDGVVADEVIEPRAPSLSPSRAADFKACPLRYRFRMIDRLAEAPSTAAVRGTLVHGVLERIFDLPPPVRTLHAAETLLEPTWSALVELDSQAAELFEGATPPEEWLASCREALARWFEQEDPRRLAPAAREVMVETTLDSGLRLRGIVDRIDEAADGSLRIVDYKTGRAPGIGYESDALLQLRFYALVVWRSRGVLPRRIQLVYLGGDGETVSYDPDEHDLLATERLLEAVGAAIRYAEESGDWQPHRGRACRFCDFQALCPAYGGTPPPLPDRGLAEGHPEVADAHRAELPRPG